MDQSHHFCAINNDSCNRAGCKVWTCSATFQYTLSTVGKFEYSFNCESQTHFLILNKGILNGSVLVGVCFFFSLYYLKGNNIEIGSWLLQAAKNRHGVSSVDEAWQGKLMWVGEKNHHQHVQHGQALGSKNCMVLHQSFLRADSAVGQRAVLDASPLTIFCKCLY